MKAKFESFLVGCVFMMIGGWIIDTGSIGGGGPKTPLVYIGANKYWVGGVLICFGLWIVISVLSKGKSK